METGQPETTARREAHKSRGAGYPVERVWMWILVVAVVALSAFLWQFGQSVSTLAVLTSYSLFFIALRIIAAKEKLREPIARVVDPNFLPSVSVLVAAHNEENVIEQLVRTITAIDYPGLEILIVDDRSTDRTAEILHELKDSGNFDFNFVTRPPGSKPGKAAVLNQALKTLRGEAIVFFDADAKVEPGFVRALVPSLNDPKVAAVQGRKTPDNGDFNYLTRCQEYELALDGYMQSKRDTVFGAVELRGNGMLVRRAALDSVGGFNERSLTEDLDLSTRLHLAGWDIRYADDVQIWEESMPSVRKLFRQRLRWTEGSLVRYLDYSHRIFHDPKVAFRAKLDAVQFIFECVLPFWLIAENIGFVIRFANGTLPAFPTMYATLATLVLSVYFWLISFQGVARFEKAGPVAAFIGALRVYIYLTCLWIPVVLKVVVGILLRNRRNLVWIKTEHFGNELDESEHEKNQLGGNEHESTYLTATEPKIADVVIDASDAS